LIERPSVYVGVNLRAVGIATSVRQSDQPSVEPTSDCRDIERVALRPCPCSGVRLVRLDTAAEACELLPEPTRTRRFPLAGSSHWSPPDPLPRVWIDRNPFCPRTVCRHPHSLQIRSRFAWSWIETAERRRRSRPSRATFGRRAFGMSAGDARRATRRAGLTPARPTAYGGCLVVVRLILGRFS